MENIKRDIKELMFSLSESALLGEGYEETDYKEMYLKLKGALVELERIEREKSIVAIPKLPEGKEYNGYPRILYAFICEKYSRGEFFSIRDMQNLTGASKNAVRLDLERLETEGFIQYIDGKTGVNKTRYYKYKPSNLIF